MGEKIEKSTLKQPKCTLIWPAKKIYSGFDLLKKFMIFLSFKNLVPDLRIYFSSQWIILEFDHTGNIFGFQFSVQKM